ncbi:hypothetical protein [Paraglaciecola sp. L3A3]|uniref:hypothetical protein n=1 Tax=Paraglaciecola sp. L3A3 TaxID=2686358 RepID=UPI00131BEDBC|nr:hypothetical protein [Paraglaciecola sp. L3A3]
MRNAWIWNILKIIALLVFFSHLYFEIALIIKIFVVPSLEASGELKYHQGLSLFAPVLYLFEGAGKLLASLSPLVDFIREILFAINSLVLIITIVVTGFVFQNKLWAGLAVVLLTIPSLIFWFSP